MDQVNGAWTITAIHLTDAGAACLTIDAAKFAEIAGGAKANCPLSRVLNANHHDGRATLVAAATAHEHPSARRTKGRGATFNPANRFRRDTREAVDDGWTPQPAEGNGRGTTSRRRSRPTVTIQRVAHDHRPQRLARHPVHAIDQPVPGLRARLRLLLRAADARVSRSVAGTRLRDQAFRQAECRRAAARGACETRLRLRRRSRIGTNTDPYQPIEREWKITRQILEVLSRVRASGIRSSPSRRWSSATSICSRRWRRRISRASTSRSPRSTASSRARSSRAPRRRIAGWQRSRRSRDAGIPVGVMTAPIIPQLTDRDLEAILDAAAHNGARYAGWIAAAAAARGRATLFRDWLARTIRCAPSTCMSVIQQMRGGRDNDPQFGSRMRGQGSSRISSVAASTSHARGSAGSRARAHGHVALHAAAHRGATRAAHTCSGSRTPAAWGAAVCSGSPGGETIFDCGCPCYRGRACTMQRLKFFTGGAP